MSAHDESAPLPATMSPKTAELGRLPRRNPVIFHFCTRTWLSGPHEISGHQKGESSISIGGPKPLLLVRLARRIEHQVLLPVGHRLILDPDFLVGIFGLVLYLIFLGRHLFMSAPRVRRAAGLRRLGGRARTDCGSRRPPKAFLDLPIAGARRRAVLQTRGFSDCVPVDLARTVSKR